jgi:hypothetical protein
MSLLEQAKKQGIPILDRTTSTFAWHAKTAPHLHEQRGHEVAYQRFVAGYPYTARRDHISRGPEAMFAP